MSAASKTAKTASPGAPATPATAPTASASTPLVEPKLVVKSATSTSPMTGWSGFWFNPAPITSFAIVRLAAALAFLVWLVPLTPARHALFSLTGWFNAEAFGQAVEMQQRAMQAGGGIPYPIGEWSVLYMIGENAVLFEAFWWGTLIVLALYGLGVAPRLTGVLSWISLVSLVASPANHFDGDFVALVLAFYVMLGDLLLGQWSRPLTPIQRILGTSDSAVWSLWKSKPTDRPTSVSANAILRLIQVHFVLIVVVSALHKLQFGDWWAGVAFWYPMYSPFQLNADSVARMRPGGEWTLVLLTSLCYAMLAWQLALPAFAWRRSLRWLLVGGTVVGWIGLWAIYGMPVFGPLYLAFSLAFVTAGEWHWLRSKMPGARRSCERGA